MGIKLYQWQEECLEKWFANHGRGMVQAATGAGKTLLALTAADRMEKMQGQKLYVKIVVPTGALMRQWNKALREHLEVLPGQGEFHKIRRGEIGLRGGGCRNDADCRYMIYVINSARYELARQILAHLQRGEAVLLIADECHRYESGQNRLIFEFIPYIKDFEGKFFSMGLSATLPSGEAGRYLSSVLGRKIYSYGVKKAMALSTVCQYDVFHVGLSFQKEEKEEYQEMTEWMLCLYRRLVQTHPFLRDMSQKERYEALAGLSSDKNRRIAEAASLYMKLSYKRKNLVCLAGERISCVCALVKCLGSREKILIFGERISQAEELYGLLQEQYPAGVGRYHSKMGQQANKNVLERFATGEIRILITCRAMDEGMNVPDVSVGIILSGTAAQRQRVQRLGRIIRKTEGKSRASLYYLHIEESAEDACFLPDAGEMRVLELAYLPDRQRFSNPSYDKRAEKLLEDMEEKGMDRERMQEMKRCLVLGSVRSDWMLGQEEIEQQIQRAENIRDKNYWVCMKKLQNYPTTF